MTLPNLITIARLFLVPVIIWLIIDSYHVLAFWLFLLAGLSDGIDGFLARRFGLESELGTYLDPIADKALLVSLFLVLGFREALPFWLAILAVSRDILIVGAVLLSWIVNKPVKMKPLFVSKANTVAQVILIASVMAANAYQGPIESLIPILVYVTGALTAFSAFAYLLQWIRHMAKPGAMDVRSLKKKTDHHDDNHEVSGRENL
ncbi:MAG: CDP-alcohol phosphatidyltransferase [Hyphomicrobiales bacterium]|nr:MAG: CDP-alcohol phosphatidyltransferase [Hyphomicrobiales bacterium]